MPSPHTLGSIMHQPLAALTPLLLFPLENRTSTHPPSTPVSPPRPPRRPSSPPPFPATRSLSPRCFVSLSHSCASQVQRPPPPPLPSLEFHLCLVYAWLALASFVWHVRFYHPPSLLVVDPPRDVSVSLSRSLPLTLLVPIHVRPVLPRTPFSSSHLSRSLCRKRLVSSSSQFPSLPDLRPAHPRCRRRHNGAPLSEFAHSLRRLTLFVRLASTSELSPTCSQSAAHARTPSNTLAQAGGRPSRVSLSPTISSARPFFILSQSRSHLSIPVLLSSSFAGPLSLALVQRILPAPRHVETSPSKRSRLPPATLLIPRRPLPGPSPPLLPSAG